MKEKFAASRFLNDENDNEAEKEKESKADTEESVEAVKEQSEEEMVAEEWRKMVEGEEVRCTPILSHWERGGEGEWREVGGKGVRTGYKLKRGGGYVRVKEGGFFASKVSGWVGGEGW